LGESHPQHDWDLSQIADLLLPILIIDFVLQTGTKLATVCGVALTALRGEDVAVFQSDLVRGRQNSLVEEDILDAHGKSVPAPNLFGLRVWVAIVEVLDANVLDALLYLAAGRKDTVEGVDVGVNGCRECWVGGLVLGRVPEEVLAALRVEIGRPLWLLFGGSSWSHDGRLLLQKVAWAGTVWKLCGMLLPKV
jgi:hypothetical protein